MDLSIIIVNYNVKHFLEQCLHSVYSAVKSLEVEIFVVDNNSVDGSCLMVEQKFPDVRLISNTENVGFAKANNQAVKQSKGEFILLLNPDTFVQEDTLLKCCKFMRIHPEAGGLGVKMIDGKGNFLPESKRSLPTPAVAFYKVFGLSALFPKSKIFGRYHLGYLDKEKTHEVEILAGAFMFLRKNVLDKVGILDETFFMYGEDIDLSYRIIKSGFKNYYYSDTAIIHYKGESTKKGSINYVVVFYKAMIIFANKHFSVKNAQLYKFLINIAIYLRATLGIIRRIGVTMFEPLLDFVLIYAGFFCIARYWASFWFGINKYYPPDFFIYIVPVYTLAWLFFVYLFGGYEKKVKPASIFKGIASGTVFILLIYALLPESLRFSRAVLLLGALWALSGVFIVRLAGTYLFKSYRKLILGKGIKRIAVVGSEVEAKRVESILAQSQIKYEFIGRVLSDNLENKSDSLGKIQQIKEIVKINKIDELVFCSQDIPARVIIESMLSINNPSTDYKIAPPESASVIGSNSINTAGDLYVVDINSLSKGVNKRKKRMFDMVSGIFLLLLSPVIAFYVKRPVGFLKNCLLVIFGKYTWVGVNFSTTQENFHHDVKPGILNPADVLLTGHSDIKLNQRMNVMYAKDYKLSNDAAILWKCVRQLGKKAGR
jgi:O-antigen biosynthesis protein